MEPKKKEIIPGLCDECDETSYSAENSEQNIKDGTLMACTSVGHVECMKACLDAGADVNYALYGNDVTVLMIGSRRDRVNCIQLLIESGVDVNKQDRDGVTALTDAALNGNINCMKLLIQSGADVNMQSACGDTALKVAVQRGHVDCVELLAEAGADVNVLDNDGRTALFNLWDLNIPKILLRAGAHVNMLDNNSLNALTHHLTRYGPKKDVAMLLFSAGEVADETEVRVPGYLCHNHLKLNLKHLCRETIRKHLIQLSPVNLFCRVPKLGLPKPLEKYLLYNESIGPPIIVTDKPAIVSGPNVDGSSAVQKPNQQDEKRRCNIS